MGRKQDAGKGEERKPALAEHVRVGRVGTHCFLLPLEDNDCTVPSIQGVTARKGSGRAQPVPAKLSVILIPPAAPGGRGIISPKASGFPGFLLNHQLPKATGLSVARSHCAGVTTSVSTRLRDRDVPFPHAV